MKHQYTQLHRSLALFLTLGMLTTTVALPFSLASAAVVPKSPGSSSGNSSGSLLGGGTPSLADLSKLGSLANMKVGDIFGMTGVNPTSSLGGLSQFGSVTDLSNMNVSSFMSTTGVDPSSFANLMGLNSSNMSGLGNMAGMNVSSFLNMAGIDLGTMNLSSFGSLLGNSGGSLSSLTSMTGLSSIADIGNLDMSSFMNGSGLDLGNLSSMTGFGGSMLTGMGDLGSMDLGSFLSTSGLDLSSMGGIADLGSLSSLSGMDMGSLMDTAGIDMTALSDMTGMDMSSLTDMAGGMGGGMMGGMGGGGGAYVPVHDLYWNEDWSKNKFKTEFIDKVFGADVNAGYQKLFDQSINHNDATNDALRELISADAPGGMTTGKGDPYGSDQCRKYEAADIEGKAQSTGYPGTYIELVPYDDGPWAKLIESAKSKDESEGIKKSFTPGSENVSLQMNDSGSLRCLLQEMVQWKKLDTSLQINALLREYVTNAQQQQLTKQFTNQVTAASLNWAQSGNSMPFNGSDVTEPIMVNDPRGFLTRRTAAQTNTLVKQIVAPETGDGSSVGSLGVNPAWKITAAAQTLQGARSTVQDPSEYTNELTGFTGTKDSGNPNAPFANQAGMDKYFQNFNTPAGADGQTKSGWYSFLWQTQHPQDAPLTAINQLQNEARRRADEEKQLESNKINSSGGFAPTERCIVDPNDKYFNPECSLREDVTPAGGNKEDIAYVAQSGYRQIENTTNYKGLSSNPAEQQNMGIQSTGLVGFNTKPLASSPNAIQDVAAEFYRTIDSGYWNVDVDMTNWAQATMLMIYDEMKLDDSPSVASGQTLQYPASNNSVISNLSY